MNRRVGDFISRHPSESAFVIAGASFLLLTVPGLLDVKHDADRQNNPIVPTVPEADNVDIDACVADNAANATNEIELSFKGSGIDPGELTPETMTRIEAAMGRMCLDDPFADYQVRGNVPNCIGNLNGGIDMEVVVLEVGNPNNYTTELTHQEIIDPATAAQHAADFCVGD